MLKRTALILALPLFLAACAGAAEVRAVNTLASACDTLGTALRIATPHKPDMSATDVAHIDRVLERTDPICLPGSTFDPVEGVTIVRQGIGIVNAVIGAF